MRSKGISIIIDKITDSIIEVKTGKSFDTEMTPLTKGDLKQITKKTFGFDWKDFFRKTDWKIYKLTIKNDSVIQGLIALRIVPDFEGFVFVEDAESAKFNVPTKTKPQKLYDGVGPNLFAFACKISRDMGFKGYVGFISKTKLIKHYQEKMGATLLIGSRMAIEEAAAKILINRYYKS